jgi:signal transduction histidine kinase
MTTRGRKSRPEILIDEAPSSPAIPISQDHLITATRPCTPGAPELEGVPPAWLDRMLVATTALPVQDGEAAVAQAIVTALSEILPHAGVGVCLVGTPESRLRPSSVTRTGDADGAPPSNAQRVFRYAPPGRDPLDGPMDPTRIFPGFAHERVLEAEGGGTTLHLGSDREADVSEAGPLAHILGRARDALGRGLIFARAHEKATTDAADLRALSNHMVQAEKLAGLGQIAAGVVHELNNPLTSIVAYTDYLLKRAATSGTSPEDIERLRRIGESANRMLRFTRDLVTYARPSKEAPVPVHIHAVLDQGLAFCEHILAKAQVTVERRFVKDDLEVRGMPEQLAQVFVNLITNACHAMPRHGAELLVTTHLDVSHVAVHVEDNGHGIAPEHLAQIFVPFFTTKSDGHGTGLGLSIVKKIVDNHNGEIWAENRLPKGARFVVLLPLSGR